MFKHLYRELSTTHEIEVQDKYTLRICTFLRSKGSLEWSVTTHGFTQLSELAQLLLEYHVDKLNDIVDRNT